MTENFEVHTTTGRYVFSRKTLNQNEIIETIKKGLEKGTVTVNGHRVRIIQRDGKDAWEYTD